MKTIKFKNFYQSQGISEICKTDSKFIYLVLLKLADFVTNDWGNVPEYCRLMNNRALITGRRIIGSYLIDNTKIWIIADSENEEGIRKDITVLLPEEYYEGY